MATIICLLLLILEILVQQSKHAALYFCLIDLIFHDSQDIPHKEMFKVVLSQFLVGSLSERFISEAVDQPIE